MDSIYEESYNKEIYLSYLDRTHLHKMTLYFGTAYLRPDKSRRINHNIVLSGVAHDVLDQNSIYNKDKNYFFVAPQRTFTSAFKIVGIDTREYIRSKRKSYLEIKIINRKKYKIVSMKEI